MGQALNKNRENKIKIINKKLVIKTKSKDEYFIHNGGILLRKQIALEQGQDIGAGQVKIFSIKDIESATNCYDYESDIYPDHLILDWIVYKATLNDLSVFIWAPRELRPNPQLVDRSSSEASTSIVMRHENIVSLYGCCLETCVPILVFKDFLQNLYQHLHGRVGFTRKSLKWVHLVSIAAEVAYALSYMHNGLSKQVVHRDIQSHIVLLDDSFHVKLCGFDHSVSITPGSASQRWPVKGSPGYVDPEHVKTQMVTEKCDVYSFGVLMSEMLTRKHPPTMMKSTGLDLADVFVSAVGNNCMVDIICSDVLEQASVDEIELFAELALKCVAKKGTERPTMVQVTKKLWQIQGHLYK